MNSEEFIRKAKLYHQDKYDYSKSVYTNTRKKIIVICKEHGEFYILPYNHIYGRGCKLCGIKYRKKKKNLKDFILDAKKVHGNKYDYSNSIYISNMQNIEIICNIHGSFWQMPVNHLAGSGCLQCGIEVSKKSRTKTTLYFINKAVKIHGNRYDYSKSVYVKSYNFVEIICRKHGTFWQRASDHLSGNNCPKCNNLISKPEDEYFKSLNNNNIIRNKVLYINGKKFVPDGYDIVTNTIYEFYGDYWHGNLDIYNGDNINKNNNKTFKLLHSETLDRERFLRENGFTVISIWENEWKKRNRQ